MSHHAQSIVPKRLDLHRFAVARCHGLTIYSRVHPCKLRAGLAGVQQAVGVQPNAVARSPLVPGDDLRERLIEFGADEIVIAGVAQEFMHGMEHPERGVHSIIFGRFAGIGETIGQHAPIDAVRESSKNVACVIVAAGHERQAGQRDHGVAAPIAEPRVTGDDGFSIGAADDELIGRAGENGGEGIFDGRRAGDAGAALEFALLECSNLGRRAFESGGDDRC